MKKLIETIAGISKMNITIFTPTYNRKSELQGLYESIRLAYSNISPEDDIKWLIVDDGSTISIKEEINRFAKEAKFPIEFIKKENGGKHTAFNVAIEACNTDLLVCIDDDDRLTSDAIKNMFILAKKYNNNGYGAIVGRVVDNSGNILGRNLAGLPMKSNTIEIRDKYSFWGEPEVYFVDKLRDYRFDVFPGEKFLTEAYVFDKMSMEFPFLYTNDVFMVKKYLKGGLTDNQTRIRINSPVGSEAYYYQRKQLCQGFWPKLKATINRQRFQFWTENKHRKVDGYEILAMSVSWLFYLNDKKHLKQHGGVLV